MMIRFLQESGSKKESGSKMRKQLRISQEQSDALEKLVADLNISGQRGAWFQPLILWLADTTEAAFPEMVAALEIVSQCAAGGDWDELIQVVRPQWPELDRIPPLPPGEILLEEFLQPKGISPEALARALDIDPALIADLLVGRRRIDDKLADKLANYFEMSSRFWIGLQADYDEDLGYRNPRSEFFCIYAVPCSKRSKFIESL